MSYWYGSYLMHHGIKGQKWGVRRYQNEDGTLTEEGKKRYGLNNDYKEDVSHYNLKKRTKMLKKESKEIYKQIGRESTKVMYDLAMERYTRDIDEASEDKELQKDLMKIWDKYYGHPKHDYDVGNHDGAWHDKNQLYKKYPQHKRILESFGFYEDPEYFTSKKEWFKNNIDPDSWSDDYEKMAETEVISLQALAKAEWNKELTKKYGQDAVNEILKKGYSSLV